MSNNKITKFFDFLVNLCNKKTSADLRTLHAALIFSGNKIISYGYNNINHAGKFGRYTQAEHAEVSACRNYSKLHCNNNSKSCCLL